MTMQQRVEKGSRVKLTQSTLQELSDDGLTEEEIVGWRGEAKVTGTFEDASVGEPQTLNLFFPDHPKAPDGSVHICAYVDEIPIEQIEVIEYTEPEEDRPE